MEIHNWSQQKYISIIMHMIDALILLISKVPMHLPILLKVAGLALGWSHNFSNGNELDLRNAAMPSLLWRFIPSLKSWFGWVISLHGKPYQPRKWSNTLQWYHKEHDGVSNHQPHDCWFKRLFRWRSKKKSKLHVTSLCEGNSAVTGEFPAQRDSKAENVSIWWRHHENVHCRLRKMQQFLIKLSKSN